MGGRGDPRKPNVYPCRSRRSLVPDRDQALLIFGPDGESLDRPLFGRRLVWRERPGQQTTTRRKLGPLVVTSQQSSIEENMLRQYATAALVLCGRARKFLYHFSKVLYGEALFRELVSKAPPLRIKSAQNPRRARRVVLQ
jgi:hypothetical protein